MHDEKENFQMLLTSARLGDVYTGLQKLVMGSEINHMEKEELKLTADLIGQLDWDSPHYAKPEYAHLCVIATGLRPLFYEKLDELKLAFNTDISTKLCTFLKSPSPKPPRELSQYFAVFQSMSQHLLDRIHNNQI